MTPVTILKRARKLIDKPERWIKGEPKSKQNGVMAFCADGACMEVTNGNDFHKALTFDYWRAFEALNAAVRCGDIIGYNDAPTRRHSQVLRAFDRAIALAEKEAQS